MNIHPCARTCAAGRALLVNRVTREGWSVVEAAQAAGISRRTAYKWLQRFRIEGLAGLRIAARGRIGRRRSCNLKGRYPCSSCGGRSG